MAHKKNNHVLALDFSGHSLKAVQRDTELGRIDMVHAEPLEADGLSSEAYLARIIRGFQKAYKKSIKTQDAVISIPSLFTFIRVMDLDSSDDDIQDQIRWEIEQQSIGSGNSLHFDWVPAGKRGPAAAGVVAEGAEEDREEISEGGHNGAPAEKTAPHAAGSRYLVVASDEDRLKPILSALRKSRLNPVLCDVDVLALANIYFHTYPDRAENRALLSELSGDRALLCLVDGGHYLDSETVTGLDFRSPDPATLSVNRVRERMQALLRRHGGESAAEAQFYLSGEHMGGGPVTSAIQGAFSLKSEILDPLKNLPVLPELEKLIAPVAPAFSVAAGLSLRAPAQGAA